MKITINGQERKIPISWGEVTFKMFLDLADAGNDTAKILAVFTGLNADELRVAKLVNVDPVINVLAFMHTTELKQSVPDTILGYKLPKNLETSTIGQYEDLKLIIESFPKETNKFDVTHLKRYAEIVGIYTQPDYHESDDEAKAKWASQFMDAPCEEVMAIGNFTLIKLSGLRMGIGNPFQRVNTPLNRFRLALTSWLSRLAFTVRYYSWKRKHRINEMSY